VSPDEVFGSLCEAGAFNVNTAYDPSSPYSASKAAAHHLAMAWRRTYGLPVILSNCSNNHGPRQFLEKLMPLSLLNAREGKPVDVMSAATAEMCVIGYMSRIMRAPSTSFSVAAGRANVIRSARAANSATSTQFACYAIGWMKQRPGLRVRAAISFGSSLTGRAMTDAIPSARQISRPNRGGARSRGSSEVLQARSTGILPTAIGGHPCAAADNGSSLEHMTVWTEAS